MNEELVINEENFSEYFFDIRKHKPAKGQVLVCFTSPAELRSSQDKRTVIGFLTQREKALSVSQFVRRVMFATELDSYRLPKQMAEDLIAGMTPDEVDQKIYKYTLEMFYYAKPEHVPRDDPRWRMISLLNLDDFLKNS